MALNLDEQLGSDADDNITLDSFSAAFGLRGDDRFTNRIGNEFAVAAGGPGNDTYVAEDSSAISILDTSGGNDTLIADGIGITFQSSFSATIDNGQHFVAADTQSGQVVYALNWRDDGNEIEALQLADRTISFSELESTFRTLPNFLGDLTWQEVDPANPTAEEVDNAIQRSLVRQQELLSRDGDTDGGDDADDGNDTGLPEQPGIQGALFIRQDGTVNVANPLEIFGRSGGNETVLIEPDVGAVRLDANIERVDFPETFSTYSFEVGDAGLRVMINDSSVLSLPSANQAMALRFADGSADLTQTGAARFDLEGATIAETEIQPNIQLDESEPSVTATSATTSTLADADSLG